MKDRRKVIHPAAGDQRSVAGELLATLADGDSVVITGYAASAAMLDGLGEFLIRTRTRVIRVGPPLDLPDLMEQIVRAHASPGDAALEEAFLALTVPGDGYERTALLVDGAHLMTYASLRYLDFAFRAAPGLQAILAGQPAIADTLALDGFTSLRARFSLQVNWSGTPASQPSGPVVPFPAPAVGAPAPTFFAAAMPPQPYRMTPARLLASATVAASFALAIASTIQTSSPPTPIALLFGFNAALVGTNTELGGQTTPVMTAVERAKGSVAEHELQMIPGLIVAEPALQDAPGTLTNEPQQAAAVGLLPPYLPMLAELPPAALTNLDAPQPPPIGGSELAVWAVGPNSLMPSTPPPAPARARVIRSERVAARVPSGPSDPRCGAIILRMQLGEAPTKGERSFLWNGCR